jgi:polysaccharide export outer membrane protein
MVRIALAFVAALWAGIGTAQPVQDPFVFENGDQLSISVLEDPGLNTTALVRPDGQISLPIVGEVTVAGRTAAAVQASIRRALTPNFLTPPTVTVSLVALGSGRERATFFILGETSGTGRYTFEPPFNMLQALAISGGPGRFAATNRIQIRRGSDEVILFDYEELSDGAPPTDVVELRDGDVIFIPTRRLFE